MVAVAEFIHSIHLQPARSKRAAAAIDADLLPACLPASLFACLHHLSLSSSSSSSSLQSFFSFLYFAAAVAASHYKSETAC